MTQEGPYFVGIDVGTGSARAGITNAHGKIISSATHPITTWKPKHDFYEQSSTDIWNAICTCVKSVLATSGISPLLIKGVGFDATCSLVVLGEDTKPVTVSPEGCDEQNVIVWMDHRAIEQATRINALKHSVLQYVGGNISPEMETPKLLWLKENLPETWKRAKHFMDLADFLTFRATGSTVRSQCTVVCKWTYLGHEDRWDDTYLSQIGLGDLIQDNYAKIGNTIRPIGESVGGLTPEAAKELGLAEGTQVGVGIIDAHAGGVGVLGAVLPGGSQVNEEELEHRLAVISGTSTCHMAVNRKQILVDGVWGPYFSAMIPDLWLAEGGESATGALIDHVIFSHTAATVIQEKAKSHNISIYAQLNSIVHELKEKHSLPFTALLTKNFHVLPYFHGNRSPRADPHAVGIMYGLKLVANLEEELALHYYATLQAIAHGTRHIIDSLNTKGYKIASLFMTGGNAKNELFVSEHADICNCRVVLSKEPDAVILGSSIIASVAGGAYPSILAAMAQMCFVGTIVEPKMEKGELGETIQKYHETKHEIFLKMYDHGMEYQMAMSKF
eukprot:Phypoly_transcript_06801.p1 GENE.Phypoly_transcript_06801~~Phypoly_transcript_06801.p1  ORF type:complete len:559 (+),score=52.18 Phypoly_transcript_06801:37-1713(+)